MDAQRPRNERLRNPRLRNQRLKNQRLKNQRLKNGARSFGSLFHREQESYWLLLLTIPGWLALVAAVVGGLAREITTSWQPLIVLAAFSHQLLWGAALAVVAFLLVRHWRVFIASVVVAIFATLSQLSLYVAGNGGHVSLVVLQANLRVGSADAQALVRLVADRHVDVAATEELTDAERDRLVAAGISKVLPYSFQAPLATGGGGLAIWSRYPLTAEVNYPGYELGVLSARVTIGGRSSTVVAVHLLPPYPFPAAKWLDELGQLHALLGQLERQSGPVLVAGDFNATTDQGQFRDLLGGGYADAASDTGSGYLPTYPSNRWFPPLIAIDHVLSANLVPVRVSSVSLPGSDHRGLLVGFAT